MSDRDGEDSALLLDVRGLKVRYGVIEALHGVDVSVRRGEIVTVIGANGAGKTTFASHFRMPWETHCALQG